MRILEPFYYEKFKCVGGKCIDTCCRGWDISIDKDTFLKYREVKDEFGKKLNNSIEITEGDSNKHEYGKFILNDFGCPLLNEDKLCEVFINLGEESLCDTCTYYPRVCISMKDENIEKNLGLSCPEVARILVNHKGKFDFILKDSEEEKLYINNMTYDCNENLYELLWESRSFAIDIVQLSELLIYKRLILLILLGGRLQKVIDSKNISDYKNVIDQFANEIGGFATMGEINDVNNFVKIQLIYNIIEPDNNLGNKKSIGLLSFIDGKTIDQIKEEVSEKEKKFNKYIKDKEYIFENYMVYLLYTYFMKALENRNLHKQIITIMIEYACTKLLLMSRWLENGEELSEEDFVDIIYSVSRTLEHSFKSIENIYNWIIENKIDTPGHLTTLIY